MCRTKTCHSVNEETMTRVIGFYQTRQEFRTTRLVELTSVSPEKRSPTITTGKELDPSGECGVDKEVGNY